MDKFINEIRAKAVGSPAILAAEEGSRPPNAGWLSMFRILTEPQQQRRHSLPIGFDSDANGATQEMHRSCSMDMSMNKVEMRRMPSIPTSVHSGDASVVSEVTFVTYSEETIQSVRKEFHRVMKQQTTDLTYEEKESLLREIYTKKNRAFKRNKKKGRGHEFQSRAEDPSAMPLREQVNKQESEDAIESSGIDWGDGNMSVDAKGQTTASVSRLEAKSRSNGLNLSISSTVNEKCRNFFVNRSIVRERRHSDINVCEPLEEEPKQESLSSNVHTPNLNAPSSKSEQEVSREGGTSPDESLERTCRIHAGSAPEQGPHSADLNIDEFVALKLLVASQQAVIDTMFSKLHNLELANHQLKVANLRLAEKVNLHNSTW